MHSVKQYWEDFVAVKNKTEYEIAAKKGDILCVQSFYGVFSDVIDLMVKKGVFDRNDERRARSALRREVGVMYRLIDLKSANRKLYMVTSRGF